MDSLRTVSWIRSLSLLAIIVASTSLAVRAQSNPSDDGKTIQELLKRIDQLEATQKAMQEKLDKMETPPAAAQPAPPAAPASVSPPAAPVPGPGPTTEAAPSPAAPAPAAAGVAPEPSPEVATEAAPEPPATHALGPVQFSGFSDIDYGRAWFEDLPPSGLKGFPYSFSLGDFDLFTLTRISDHWSLLGELLITSDFSNEFSAEMDRLLLTYKKNDYFKISFGKYQTALGYYTTNFYRAQYFQTAIGRPIMYGDEDSNGILPTHNIGISATGVIPSRNLGLQWVAELANGSDWQNPDDEQVQNFVSYKTGKAVNLALYMRPERLNGFQAGVSVYHDRQYPETSGAVDQTIVTLHVVYIANKFEFLNEGAVVREALVGTNRVFHDPTSYSQISYGFGKTRPFFRYDYENISSSDPIFGIHGRHNGPSVGVARHLNNYVILKLQYGRLDDRVIGGTNDFLSQLAFAF